MTHIYKDQGGNTVKIIHNRHTNPSKRLFKSPSRRFVILINLPPGFAIKDTFPGYYINSTAKELRVPYLIPGTNIIGMAIFKETFFNRNVFTFKEIFKQSDAS